MKAIIGTYYKTSEEAKKAFDKDSYKKEKVILEFTNGCLIISRRQAEEIEMKAVQESLF